MATYSKITDKSNSNRGIQVESAIRDGSGKNIENNYSKQNGYYENERVGLADELSSNRQIENPETACPPITMGITGGEAEIKTGLENFEYMEGNSVAFNQLAPDIKNSTQETTDASPSTWGSSNTTWSATDGVVTFTPNGAWACVTARTRGLVTGHKYYLYIEVQKEKAGMQLGIGLGKGSQFGGEGVYINFNQSSTSWNALEKFGTFSGSGDSSDDAFIVMLMNYSTDNTGYIKFRNWQLFDLTNMFGVGNEPTTVAPIRAKIGSSRLNYNNGAIISAKVSALISRRRQQWDEEWELGIYDYHNGNPTDANNRIRAKNNIPVIGGEKYYIKAPVDSLLLFAYDINGNYIGAYIGGDVFTTEGQGFADNKVITMPMNASYVKFYIVSTYGTTYKHDITFSVYFADGEDYEQYYAYSESKVVLPNIELRAIGDLKDIAYASGGGKRRLGKYTFTGSELINDSGTNFVQIYATDYITDMKVDASCKAQMANFVRVGWGGWGSTPKCFCFLVSGTRMIMRICGVSSVGELAGNDIIYELATETELTENTGWNEQVVVDNYGTLQFVTDPEQIPQVAQPYFIKYTISLKEMLDSVYVNAGGDADNIVYEEEMALLQEKLEKGHIKVNNAKLADNLNTNIIQNDTNAVLFRTAGGSLEIGEMCKEKKIIGGSLGFNQKIQIVDYTSTIGGMDVTKVASTKTIKVSGTPNIGYGAFITTYNWIKGHKYYIYIKLLKNTGNKQFDITCLGNGVPAVGVRVGNVGVYQAIKESNNTISQCGYGWVNVSTAETYDFELQVNIIDLTLMFGSGVANYVYTIEQATAGSGSLWLKKYMKSIVYDFNAGQIASVQTSGKKYTGFNHCSSFSVNSSSNAYSACLFLKAELMPNTIYCISFVGANGNVVYANENLFDGVSGYSSQITCNGQRQYVIVKTKPYITKENGQQYNEGYGGWIIFKNGAGNAVSPSFTTVCVNYHYDGERDGDYEEYEAKIYQYDEVELRGMPKVDNQGNLYFDGDEYASDGSVKRKYGIVDLGDLTWTAYTATGGHTLMRAYIANLKVITNYWDVISNGISTKYHGTVYGAIDNSTSYPFGFAYWYGYLYIYDSNYTDPATFKTAMSGQKLVYELETPTDDTDVNEFIETQDVDNWGSEEYLPPENDTRPCEIPVGHSTDYLLDIRSKVEIMPDSPTDDGVYVVQTSSGTNEYIPLGTWLTNNDYKQSKDLPTKEALGGTLRQLLAVSQSVDFANTAFVDLGELNWSYDGTNAKFVVYNVGSKKNSITILSTLYKTVSPVYASTAQDNMTVATRPDYDGTIYFKNTAYTDTTTFKNAMKGVLLAYEKASS